MLPCEMFQLASLLCNFRTIEFRMIHFVYLEEPNEKQFNSVSCWLLLRAEVVENFACEVNSL